MAKTLLQRILLAVLAVSGTVGAQQPPPDLAALAADAKLAAPPSAWCRGGFRPGHPGAFAVAVPSPSGGGRYFVLEPGARATELAAYTGGADLSCYSPREAGELDATIQRSETIQGRVTPRWGTTVVCGFTDDTTAACWQYSPRDRAFVRVGGWVT